MPLCAQSHDLCAHLGLAILHPCGGPEGHLLVRSYRKQRNDSHDRVDHRPVVRSSCTDTMPCSVHTHTASVMRTRAPVIFGADFARPLRIPMLTFLDMLH